MRQFPLHFEVICQAGGFNGRRCNRATRLGCVRAISEAAILCQLLNIVEGILERTRGLIGFSPQLNFAQAWEVHKEPAAGHDEKLAGGGGVASAAVRFANGSGGLAVIAQETVKDGGFAYAGRANEGGSLAGCELGGQDVESVIGDGADGNDGGSGTEKLGAGDDGFEVEGKLGGKVGFVEQDDGARAAFRGHDQIALDAAGVVVAIEAADDEQDVNVCGKDLLADLALGLLSS